MAKFNPQNYYKVDKMIFVILTFKSIYDIIITKSILVW